jgi:hypothetical protein
VGRRGPGILIVSEHYGRQLRLPPGLFLPPDRNAIMRLKALRPMTYATRRLLPGDVFEAKSRRDHRVLLATRKVEAMREPASVPPPPPAVAKKIAEAVAPPADDDLSALRAEYERAVGRRPFMGWDAATLREKMAAAASS